MYARDRKHFDKFSEYDGGYSHRNGEEGTAPTI